MEQDSKYPIILVKRLRFPLDRRSSHSSLKTEEVPMVSQRLTPEEKNIFVSRCKHSTEVNGCKVEQSVNVQEMLECEKCFNEGTRDASYNSPSHYETAVTSNEKNSSLAGNFFSLNETQVSVHHCSEYKHEIENKVGLESSKHLKNEFGSSVFENKVSYHKYQSTHMNLRTKSKKSLLNGESKNYLGEYFGSHYKGKVYRCSECSYSTKLKGSLLNHLKVHKPLFRCDHCSFTSKYKLHVKKHLNSHRLTKSFKCSKCPLVLEKYSRFLVHLKTHKGKKTFTCNICSYSSEFNRLLQCHLRTHNKEKSFKCDKCSYAGTTGHNLRMHSKLHSENKPYKCHKCPYSTAFPSRLRSHGLSHSSERPFKCEKCPFAAKRNNDLKVHIKFIHSKHFTCSKCLFFSQDKGEVINHLRFHCKPMKE